MQCQACGEKHAVAAFLPLCERRKHRSSDSRCGDCGESLQWAKWCKSCRAQHVCSICTTVLTDTVSPCCPSCNQVCKGCSQRFCADCALEEAYDNGVELCAECDNVTTCHACGYGDRETFWYKCASCTEWHCNSEHNEACRKSKHACSSRRDDVPGLRHRQVL